MCTHITLKGNDKVISARTMDFSFQLDPELVFTPRRYPLKFKYLNDREKAHKAFLGLSKNIGDYRMADGINEDGLSCSALYFEGYASYNENIIDDKINLTADEFLHWILSYNSSISDVMESVKNLNIVESKIEFIGGTPPLHWVIVDSSGDSIIIEPIDKKLVVYANEVGVLTNSPDYNWHITNMRNYIGIDMNQVEERKFGDLELKPFGQGSGSFGLPGDYTPPSRFVRGAFNSLSCRYTKSNQDQLINAIHILNTVSIPKGSVITQRKTLDYTQYTSYMDLSNKLYYFKTYDNQNIYKEKIEDYNLDGSELIIKKLNKNISFLDLD